MTHAILMAALSPRARAALALARRFDPACDEASAYLAAIANPDDSPAQLAARIRASARREKRAGGAHGPGKFTTLDDLDQASEPGGDDPAEIAEAVQAVAARPGLAAALTEREPASDTRELAQRDHCTRRRVQQYLAARRRLEDGGQLGLWGCAA